MPELSRFLGLVLKMVYKDHPPPHFHVFIGKKKVASIRIRNATLLEGSLPRPQLLSVLAWTVLHQQELLDAWDAARQHLPIKKIAPLK